MKFKICIVSPFIPPNFAGAGKRALNHAKYIAQNGHEVSILTTTKTNFSAKNLKVITIKMPKFHKKEGLWGVLFRFLYRPVLLIKMICVMLKNKFHVVHCISGGSWFSLLSILSGKILGAKVVTETTLVGSDDPITIKKNYLGFIKFKLFKLSDNIVNISPMLYETCLQANLKNEYCIIGNSVDISKFERVSNVRKNQLRTKLGLNKSSYIILYVGVIRERKGVDYLINMFNTINNSIDNAYLVLVGPLSKDSENLSYSNKIKKSIVDYNLEDKVLLTGEVSNVDEWMKASDVFVFASKREGFGTVLVEAMSTGLPVVTTNIPNITDYIIKNNFDGIIVSDDFDLAPNVIRLYKDKEFYDYVSNNAINTVLNRFSEKIIMGQYFDLYSNLMSKG
ncbi:MAG: glycosyltransferase family 4 protein [bacterium]